MTDWDSDSARLHANLKSVLSEALALARQRSKPSIEQMRIWHINIMAGLVPPDERYVGRFRAEPGLQDVDVHVAGKWAPPANEVAAELAQFEKTLLVAVDQLDHAIAPEGADTRDQLDTVLKLCAWAHAEWVRIHPFANGNGRTARLWANWIALLYGLPPFVRLRPRPDHPYGAAAARAMEGDWNATVAVMRQMLRRTLSKGSKDHAKE